MDNKSKREVYPNSGVIYWTGLNTPLAAFLGVINGLAVMLISGYFRSPSGGSWTQNSINVFFYVVVPLIIGFLSILTIPQNQRYIDNATIMIVSTTISVSIITIVIQGIGYIGLSCLCIVIPAYLIISSMRAK